MASSFSYFEALARVVAGLGTGDSPYIAHEHAFETRNIHPKLPCKVRGLFDDGHYAEATFEACKFLDKEIQRHTGSTEIGRKLMSSVFNIHSPRVKLNPLRNDTDKSEQEGYMHLFMGSVLAIRNPRGHEHSVLDSPDVCLDHLAFVSLLLRRLAEAGYK